MVPPADKSLPNVHLLIKHGRRIRGDLGIHIGGIAECPTQATIDTTNGITAGGGRNRRHGGGGSYARWPFATPR